MLETIGERISLILKELGIKKTEMARRLSISNSSVSTMCSGKSNPSSQTIKMICREFGVNEEWLRSGSGKMRAPAYASDLDALAKAQGLTHDQYILLQKFIGLKPAIRQGILDYIVDVAASVGAAPNPVLRPGPEGASKEELHAELDRQIQEEKTAEEASGAS